MKTRSIILLTTIAACALPASAAPDLTKLPPAAKKPGLTHAKDIRPIFEATCFRCHGEEEQKGDLRLPAEQVGLIRAWIDQGAK